MTDSRLVSQVQRRGQLEAAVQREASANEIAVHEPKRPRAKLAPHTTVIIPAYNEEEGLPLVLDKLSSSIDQTYEVIVVDDASTDDTVEVAARFPCRLLTHTVNRGKGEAMKTGIRAARAENLIFIDADDTYPAEIVSEMANKLDHVDMVVGSRVRGKDHIPAFNRIGNALFRNAIRHLYGFAPHDPLTGFYGIKKAHLAKMRLDSSGFGIETEIAIKAARMGLRTFDIPVEYRPRVGAAKLRGLQDGYRIFQTIVKLLALYNPTVSFILPGGALFALGLFVMSSLLVGSLNVGGFSPGINSFVLAAMLALAGFQLGVFGFALNLYGVAHKFTRQDTVTRLLLRNHMARNFALLALGLVGVGVGLATWLGPGWLAGDVNDVSGAKRLVSTSFLGVLGLQVLVSSVFLSIFAREVAAGPPQPAVGWDVWPHPGGIEAVPETSLESGEYGRSRLEEDT
jgi:glycosyltransferase involved in cell wall biosynthesis